MDNILMTILGIFLAAILIFVFPLMAVTERNDNIAQTVVETATIEFVDKISISGVIKPADYEEYIQKLDSTGNTFDVQIEVQHLDENFGKKNGTTSQDLIGENERYSTFTTEILENMYLSDGSMQNYMLKKGDNVIVTAKNTNKTMAQTLRTFVNKVTGKGTYEIAATSSSMVVNNGGKVQLGDSGYEPDEDIGTEINYDEVIQIKAVATFDGDNRPEKVIATLLKEVNGQITIENKELNSTNNWQYTWNINKYENENIVKYIIEGNEVEGYDYLGSISTNNIVYLKYKYKPKVNTEYTIGQEITLKGEEFYVIGQNTDIVTLLAKYNLKADGSAQDTTGEINPCAFSAAGNSIRGENLNNNETLRNDTTSAVYKASQYAENTIGNGATGRLMTYGEAEPLSRSNDNNIKKIIYGTYSEGAYLNYWLGSASDTNIVWFVNGNNSLLVRLLLRL